MSKFVEAVELYKSSMEGLNEALLTKVAKGLGPSIYLVDASKVSCSDQTEMDRVKTNFLIKKLGLADGPALDAAIKEVCDKMGSGNRNKYRAVFYTLLVEKFGKQDVYNK